MNKCIYLKHRLERLDFVALFEIQTLNCIHMCMFIDCCIKLQNHTLYKIYEKE